MDAETSKARNAPVALFVYNRPDHTARALDALQQNTLAPDTDIYVFCDGPKSELDRAGVMAVRALFDSVTGFRSVSVLKRDGNLGLARSIISGVGGVVQRHGRVIVIEDDLITHPQTLSYFNRLLDHFETHAGVFTISGYTYPPDLLAIPDDYEFDVYAIPRMQCWGWATWRDRWAKADFSVADFAQFDRSPTETAAYAHWIGSDSLRTLRSSMRGEKDVWACRWVYAHFRHHAVCICPTRSYIDNIGLDGSGMNCGAARALRNTVEHPRSEELHLLNVAFVDPRIFEKFMCIVDPRWRPVAAQSHSQDAPPRAPSAKRQPSLARRVVYWARRPRAFARRLRDLAAGWATARFAAYGARAHRALRAPPSVPLVRLGTEYGGWCVPERGLGPDDTIVSAGAGEDISFDVALVERFGCRVLIMDPTPRAIAHFEATKAAIAAGEKASINTRIDQFYEATPGTLDRLVYRPWGLWKRNATVRFFEPANRAHVSHSIDNLHQTGGGFEAECVTLTELLRREGLERVSVLKMDIEGAEFAVIDDLLASQVRPRYLLVEFHPGKSTLERRFKLRTLWYLRKLARNGYRLVENRDWDYVLERQV